LNRRSRPPARLRSTVFRASRRPCRVRRCRRERLRQAAVGAHRRSRNDGDSPSTAVSTIFAARPIASDRNSAVVVTGGCRSESDGSADPDPSEPSNCECGLWYTNRSCRCSTGTAMQYRRRGGRRSGSPGRSIRRDDHRAHRARSFRQIRR